MKKYVLVFFAFLSLNNSLLSQEVLTSSGDFFSNPNGSFSITIGEIIGETFSANNFYLTQGFQQNEIVNNQLTSIENDFLIIYPNPSCGFINIKSENLLDGELIFLNLAGSEVLKTTLEKVNFSSISIRELKQANYFIYYRNNQNITFFLGNLIKIDL
jgi:hypothetical protein